MKALARVAVALGAAVAAVDLHHRYVRMPRWRREIEAVGREFRAEIRGAQKMGQAIDDARRAQGGRWR